MKEVLLALAKYNRGVNLNLIDVLSKASPEVLSKETGTYYKTILGTIHHCFWYEVVWLKRYKALGDYPSLSAPILAEEVEAIKAGAGNDWAKLSALMKEIDSLFVAFAQEVKAEDLLKPIKFKNYKGEEQERLAWHTVFHVLNHYTHHRGEISAALDQMGVVNDYSGFFRYL